MSGRPDRIYYQHREEQERSAAARSRDAAARRVHLELAARYAELAGHQAHRAAA